MRPYDEEFERIYREYYGRVYAFLFRLCGSSDTAEDLMQETFCQAYISFPGYDGSCSVFTWLCAIAKNLFFKYLRRNRHAVIPLDLYVDTPSDDPDSEPGYRVSKEIEAEKLRDAVASLPPKYADVIILRVFGELSYSEISSKLGISVSSAKVIFFRAKKTLKEKLIDE